MTDDNARTRKPARPPRKKRRWPSPLRDTGLLSGALVAGVAASASYTHMQELASSHGRGPLALIGGHRAARTAILTVSRTRAEQLTRTRVGTRGPAGRGPRAVPSGAVAYGRWRVRSLRRADWREGVGRSRAAEVEVANAVDVQVWVARR